MVCKMMIFSLSGVVALLVCSSHAGPATESYKDQYCTDPRTMQKHKAYTEWADAYSCTRHRCQPGGRNLAIYTVGCKRVEAPESAIECEEVVEDTNMQFPYCCTRLRCLVVVRGEVWTRVLGQPWETLPAAPWSHMYKMKKPPPGDSSFLPKVSNEGPIYELTSDVESDREKVLRASKKTSTESPDCNEVVPRSVPAPDIVIALSTGNEPKERNERAKSEQSRYNRGRKQSSNQYYDEDVPEHRNEVDNEEQMVTEKPVDPASEEKLYANSYGVTQKPIKHHQAAWTEVPAGQWSEHETDENHGDPETVVRDGSHQPEFPPIDEKPQAFKEEKPTNLQALVDAIGTRMRDIENVVQRMSEKVHQPDKDTAGDEKRPLTDTEGHEGRNKHHKESREPTKDRMKRPNPDDEHYKRFSVRNRGSKYLHTTDSTTEQPLFVEDNNMNGYFSDASNSLVRRANTPKLGGEYNSTSHERIAPEVLEEHAEENRHHAHHCNHSDHHRPLLEPLATYMAPVENRRTSTHILASDSEEAEKKKKKHSHRRKKGKGKSHHKHHRDEKKKRTNKNSVEVDRNVVSLEDSSAKK